MTDHCPLLPSFFIVGPPRTGTSWLQEVLEKRCVLPKVKETRFFDTNFHRGWAWYRANYKAVEKEPPIGEVAPTYFGSALARERIAHDMPGARVICIFREPVERLLSHYRVRCAYAMIPWSFQQAIVADEELIESAKYASHLKAWQLAMGKANVLAVIYEDLKADPQTFVDGIADFIRLPRFRLTPAEIHCVHASSTMTYPRSYLHTRGARIMADWFKVRGLAQIVALMKKTPLTKLFLGGGVRFADLEPETTYQLYEWLRPEVEELERMLGRKLTLWKTPKHLGVISEIVAGGRAGGNSQPEKCTRVATETG